MTLQQFTDLLMDTDNNIFNIIVYDEKDLGKVVLSKTKNEDFYLGMISEKSINSEIKNIYFNNDLAEITLYAGPRIDK